MRSPCFGTEGSAARLFCSTHKQPARVNIASRRCQYVDCRTCPSFNAERRSAGCYCTLHPSKITWEGWRSEQSLCLRNMHESAIFQCIRCNLLILCLTQTEWHGEICHQALQAEGLDQSFFLSTWLELSTSTVWGPLTCWDGERAPQSLSAGGLLSQAKLQRQGRSWCTLLQPSPTAGHGGGL